MSLSWPTARAKAARTTGAGTFRVFAGSRSSQPRSPARSPPRSAVSHSETARHCDVNVPALPCVRAAKTWSSCASASPSVLVAFFGTRSPFAAWQPACLSRMCRQRTFVSPPPASVRGRFGAPPPSDCDAHVSRTAAATKGSAAPFFLASSRTVAQAARGRSFATWERTRPRSLAGASPEERTVSTVSRTPRWSSSRTAQCVEGFWPSPTTSRLSMLPVDMPSGPNSMQTAPHVAARVRRPPRSSATAMAIPLSDPTSLARFSIESASTASSVSFCHMPRYAASRGSNRMWRPFAAASATAPPLARPSYTANIAAGASWWVKSSFIEAAARCRSPMITWRLAKPSLPTQAAASPRTDKVALMSSPRWSSDSSFVRGSRQ
mmetsp:Transcript_32054/g.90171  ORF Transcript_32054/g.90171 Transcript_32054/m.90171 type:complete len:379 (-) Transcript_32054:347-1483(-)